MRARVLLTAGVMMLALGAATARTAEPTTYGAGVSLKDATPIAKLLAEPDAFEGKTVRVEGTVTAVCAQMGCWMALAPSDKPDGPTLRLKVEDGVIVFPVTAKGHRAAAQGVVERVKADDAEGQEAAAEHAGHTAAAKPAGTAAKAEAKPDAASQWHIKATGAVVY